MHMLIPWKKKHANFQNDRYETVRRVTHFLYIEGEKG